MVKDAQRNGEIREDVDPNTFAFELDAFINATNWTWTTPGLGADAPRHPCMHRAHRIMNFTGQVADPRIGRADKIMIRIAQMIS